MLRTTLNFLSTCAFTAIVLLQAQAQDKPPSSVVYCYDAARDVVTRALASECKGVAIDEKEAERVQQRRAADMATRLRAALRAGRPGMKLAAIGTAFYVDERGKLVTNHHVVSDCDAVTIRAYEQPEETEVSIASIDIASDLAILQTSAPAPAIAIFEGSSILEPAVTTVGFPNEGLAPLEPALTTGTILRGDDLGAAVAHVLVKADIRHGNSGGPIFDRYGRVLGVISAKVDSPRVFKETRREITDVGMGIGLRSVLGFLSRNNVAFHVENGGPVLGPEQMLSSARRYVVRANCWRK